MSPAKRFLLIFVIVYAVGGIAGNVLWGPPGLSKEYLETGTNSHDHDRYLEIVKSNEYRRYAERPHLADVDSVPGLANDIAFVEEYENRDAFRQEEQRRDTYYLFFEIYNVLAVIIIAVHFARKPLLNFLDEQVAEVRAKIERAHAAHNKAAQRKADAQAKLDGFGDDKGRIAEQTKSLMEEEIRQIKEATEQLLAQIGEEAEQRKALEAVRARMLVKRELVTQAIDELAEQLKASATQERQSAYIEQFERDLINAKQTQGSAS